MADELADDPIKDYEIYKKIGEKITSDPEGFHRFLQSEKSGGRRRRSRRRKSRRRRQTRR